VGNGDNGMLVVPDEPGLGLDVDAAAIERYEVK
jgi:L-alanine-DL-glutamate epimerase-like enolase superfamily enzyme